MSALLCPHGCGERLYPDGKHSNAEAAELAKHARECPKLRATLPGVTVAPAKPAPITDRVNSARAQRWSMFYAAALQGLLAAPPEARSEEDGDQNELAAAFADDALRQHDRRFR